MSTPLCYWLLLLAPVPVPGWEPGEPIIIRHPQSVTVCAGDVAVFSSETDFGHSSWKFNDELLQRLPPEQEILVGVDLATTPAGSTVETITVKYNEFFNGIKIQAVVGEFRGSSEISPPAYLNYYPQYPVANLTATASPTSVRLDWQPLRPGLATHYRVNVYSGAVDNALVDSQTINTTHYTFSLFPGANDSCHDYRFRVSDDSFPDPYGNTSQLCFSAVTFREPATVPVTLRFSGQEVQVSWIPAGDISYQVNIIHLNTGNQTRDIIDPGSGESGSGFTGSGSGGQIPDIAGSGSGDLIPAMPDNRTMLYIYKPQTCGAFTIRVAPARCLGHEASTHFSIACPTMVMASKPEIVTTTLPATETTTIIQPTAEATPLARHSGSRTDYPRYLLFLVLASIL